MAAMKERVYVAGVGMTKFRKPETTFDENSIEYPDYAKVAVQRALEDACLKFDDVKLAVVGSCFNTGNGQRCLYEMGMNGIPIFNVANACATGSNALYLARSFVESGQADCCLALGLEIMKPGPLGAADATKGSAKKGRRRVTGMDGQLKSMTTKYPLVAAPLNPQMFGNAGREHMKLYGSQPKHFAMIGEKNHRHSKHNPYSQFRDEYSLEEVESSRMIYEPLTKLQCSPTSDGAAAAILCSEQFVKDHGLQGQAVEIIGQSMKTDLPSAMIGDQPRTCINCVGFDMAKTAAEDVYKQTGLSAQDCQVVELHDCFSCNELITYEALGMANIGEGHKIVENKDNTYGGKWVVNPSGGLISKGHPLGATGLAQCCELNWQLRNEAGKRQVPNAKVALQHNLGLGGNCVVTMYQRPKKWEHIKPKRKVSGGMGFENPSSKL